VIVVVCVCACVCMCTCVYESFAHMEEARENGILFGAEKCVFVLFVISSLLEAA